MPSDNLLGDLPEKAPTKNVNNSTELVVNQPVLKCPENKMGMDSLNTLLTTENVEKLQSDASTLYPFFPAMAGSAGESPMVTHYTTQILLNYVFNAFQESSCEVSEMHTPTQVC